MDDTETQETVESSSLSPRHSFDTVDEQQTPNNPTPGTSFTFVVNNSSQAPATGDNNPSADRFAHTRSKRKRTSPADFAILEREYEREPRPDRAARCEIASRVALNEKEVQIWFQNRRQMTRRKARTWQPNEISSIIHSTQMTAGSASPPQSQPASSQEYQSSQSSTADRNEEEINQKPGNGLFANASLDTFNGISRVESRAGTAQEDGIVESMCRPETEQEDVAVSLESSTELPSIIEQLGTVTSQSIRTHLEDGTPGMTAEKKRTLKRSSSGMRLRVSMEGKAELVPDKNTPSPPSKTSRRESWPARAPLQRSQSAVIPPTPSLALTASDAPDNTSSSQPWARPRAVGRSRDARTWEFYCDPEARDALSIAAEHDRKGLAQGALGLLRSNSASAKHKLPGSPLLPNLRKQNSTLRQSVNPDHSKENFSKRKSLEDIGQERPKLARTASSLARLQTTGLPVQKGAKTAPLPSLKPRAKNSTKKGDSLEIFEDAETDSDKENWQPGTRLSAPAHPRQQHSSGANRQVLGANLREISHESSIGALLNSKNTPGPRRRTKTNQAAEKQVVGSSRVDDEVASFMGDGEHATQGDDLNAVQSLLSLSKGGRW